MTERVLVSCADLFRQRRRADEVEGMIDQPRGAFDKGLGRT
jgi:hypothetical protein